MPPQVIFTDDASGIVIPTLKCYHPLFVFNQDGDVEWAKLRSGNVASADDWRSVLEPVIARYRPRKTGKYFRGDAAFAIPKLYELLEAEGYRYAIRLKANPILERHISHLLTRPVGRPPKKPVVRYHSFEYQAKSWDTPRRVIAKIEWHQSELFPRVNFVVTNLTWSPKKVVAFYNKRGLAEPRGTSRLSSAGLISSYVPKFQSCRSVLSAHRSSCWSPTAGAI